MKKIVKQNGLLAWISARYPVQEFWKKHLSHYYAARNFNFWYYFGSFSLLVLFNQIVTGIWLAMEYTPTAADAFSSIQHIMRDVRYGWLIRLMHTTGASAFFVVVYLHMYRALIYGSYKFPRELLWIIGMLIYLFLLLEAFTGYVLPWGQMSYWGAEVITSFASAIPWIGKFLVTWLRGDFNVSGVTLHRFFSLHVSGVPLIILLLVFLHLVALHYVGSNNPDGIDLPHNRQTMDDIPFQPYYTLKDLVGAVIFLIIFFAIVFFEPSMQGLFLEAENYLPANPLQTPPEISPVWYMTPFYAILRAIPNKLLGLFCMASAIALMFVLPWLDKSPVRSIRYKGSWSKVAIVIFVISFIGLGYVGIRPVSSVRTLMAQIFTAGYFGFFLLMPFYSRFEKSKRPPEHIIE